jgi:hypothetical protein
VLLARAGSRSSFFSLLLTAAAPSACQDSRSVEGQEEKLRRTRRHCFPSFGASPCRPPARCRQAPGLITRGPSVAAIPPTQTMLRIWKDCGMPRELLLLLLLLLLCCCYRGRMRPQILKTWDQSFTTVLFKHYVSPLSVYSHL